MKGAEQRNRQTQSGPKHREKSSALRRRLKAVSDVDEVTLDGRLFQTCEAATGNARSPVVVVVVVVAVAVIIIIIIALETLGR